MRRYATVIEDDVVAVEADGDRLEVGALSDVFDLVGGEEFAIQYDEETSWFGEGRWLETDDQGRLTIDVRETLEEMSFPQPFVDRLRNRSTSAPDGEDYPERVAYFAEVMVDVWETKGNLESRRSDNPFL